MRLHQRFVSPFLASTEIQGQFSVSDRSSWYQLKGDLLSPLLQSTFMQSFFDSETQKFISDSIATSGSLCLQVYYVEGRCVHSYGFKEDVMLYYALMSFILSFFLSKTSINGILNRGAMFLFSTKQLRYFLNIPTEWNPIDKRVLDLGAGDGRVTKKLAAFYANVHTTEMSQVMEWRLRSRNFIIEDVEAWSSSLYGFDLISVLNLLDRHYNPRKLLRDVYVAALRSNCSVLVAIVLPIDQYVEFHPSKRTNRADVRLKVKGNTIEQQASSLVENEFIPLGFQVVRWTKLPYLCEGDLNRPFYVLEDVVFLLHPLPTETLRLSSSNGFTYFSNEL